MKQNIKLLQDNLISINSQPTEHDFGDNKVWYKSHRKGPTGIGKTFEDLLGKTEDNLQLPDFHDIELKAHDQVSNNFITLFTKSPSAPRGVNTLLRENYGYAEEGSNQKILHTSVSSNLQFNQKSNRYFQIINDEEQQVLKLLVYNDQRELIQDNFTAEWSYQTLMNSLDAKLKTLAIIKTSTNMYDGDKYYSYDSIQIIYELSLAQLLEALEDHKLYVDLRLGVYRTGKNIGRTHDHGTGFRISFNDLLHYANTDILEK